jgi:FkbM family methyltransferase
MIFMLKNNFMYYAEFNSDKYIRENFFPNLEEKGLMIEVGAGPTTFYSMSKHFRDNGWRAVCIDPNPKFVMAHKNLGHEIYELAISNYIGESEFNIVSSGWDQENDGISYSGLNIKYNMPNHKIDKIKVNVTTLNSFLTQINVNVVDFISIDVEGSEIEVMEGFDVFKYKPKVILLENYEHNPNYEIYMESLGYVLNKKIEYNYIFEKKLS